MKRSLFLFAFMALFVGLTNAQSQPAKGINGGNPSDWPAEVREKYTLLGDNTKQKKFTEALPALEWLLENHPQLHKNVYIRGIKVYHGLVEKATNDKKDEDKVKFQDKAMDLYDARIKYFGQEATVLKYKAYYAPYYWTGRRTDDLYKLYEKIVNISGNKTEVNVVTHYMAIATTKKKNKQLNEEQILALHEKLTKIAEANTGKKGWEKTKTELDAYLASVITVDCDFIYRFYVPKYKADPENVKMIEQLLARMIVASKNTKEGQERCTKKPLFLELAEKLFKKKPTYGRAMNLVNAYREDKEKSKFYLEKAIELAEDKNKKADAYLQLASMQRSGSAYGAARTSAFQAAKLNPSVASKAYSMVAYMYMASGKSCNGTNPKNPCHAKAIYIAAYNMFQKAGNTSGMANARKYFPTKEDVFTHAMQGKAVNVGCWVGETVTIVGN